MTMESSTAAADFDRMAIVTTSDNETMFLNDTINENSTNAEVFIEQKIENVLMKYVLPIVILVGTIGNVLSFVVLLRSRMRSTSVYFYLMVLAAADTMVLYVSAFKTWIFLLTGFELLNASNEACKIVFFLLLVSFHLAAWIIVLITLDRFIAVWFPLKATTMCVLSRARAATIILILTVFVYQLHVFWTFELQWHRQTQRMRCMPTKGHQHFNQLPFNILKVVTYSFLPFLIIMVLNVAIIVRLRKTPIALIHGGGGGHDTSGTYSTRSSTRDGTHLDGAAGPNRTRASMHLHIRLTYMLLTVSFVWLLLTAPWSMYSLITQESSRDPQTKARQILAKSVCFLLYYTNHSINFFLYCITGNKFRRELMELFFHVFRRGRGPWPVYSPSVKTIRSNCIEMDAAAGGETSVRGRKSSAESRLNGMTSSGRKRKQTIHSPPSAASYSSFNEPIHATSAQAIQDRQTARSVARNVKDLF